MPCLSCRCCEAGSRADHKLWPRLRLRADLRELAHSGSSVCLATHKSAQAALAISGGASERCAQADCGLCACRWSCSSSDTSLQSERITSRSGRGHVESGSGYVEKISTHFATVHRSPLHVNGERFTACGITPDSRPLLDAFCASCSEMHRRETANCGKRSRPPEMTNGSHRSARKCAGTHEQTQRAKDHRSKCA